MFIKQLKITFVSLLLPLMLTACQVADSSKNDNPDSSDSSDVKIGSFKGITISGLRYSTASKNGLTNSEGQFEYQAGETISFSFAGINLGEAVSASNEIILLNLIPNAKIYTTTNQITELFKTAGSSDYLAFNQVHNLLTLLMSLDKDSNPDNGIQLTSEIEELAFGLSFTFNLKNIINKASIETSNEIQLKRVMQKAAYDGLIQSGYSKKPGVALDDYYRIMGIDHDLSVLSEELTEDYGENTVINRIRYTYDSEGRQLTRKEEDPANPNTQSSLSSRSYDNRGNILTDSFSHNEQLKRRYTYTYDNNGNRLSSHNDDSGDGNSNSVSHINYDEFGQILTINQDLNNNGNSDVLTTNTYDHKGNKLTYFYTQGGVEKKAYYRYDESSNLLGYTFDSSGNGVIDRIGDYAYDNQGNLLFEKLDQTGNGDYDKVKTYTYNIANKVLIIDTDSNGDGTVNKQEKNEYDSQGNLFRISTDSNGDGLFNAINTYTFDGQGKLLSFINDSTGNGSANYIFTFTYDARGNRLTSSEDVDGDGGLEKLTSYSYDESDNLTRVTIDILNNGVVDEINIHTYDENNNQLTSTEDSDGDGIPELITYYQYVSASWQGLLF